MISNNLLLSSLLILGGLSLAKAQEQNVTFSGRLQGIGDTEVRILNSEFTEIGKTNSLQDSFRLELPVNTKDQRFYILHVPKLGDLGPSMIRPIIFFLTGPKAVQINAKVVNGSLAEEQILGSKAHDDFNNTYENLASAKLIKQASADYNKAFNAYNKEAMTEENKQELKRQGRRGDSLYVVLKSEIMDLVKKDPNSMVNAMLATQYCPPQANAEAISTFLAMFADPVKKQSYYLQKLTRDLQKFQQIQIGQLAPDFSLAQLDEQQVSLSSLKGKYVLLDFWASWCRPCRKEMPHVKAALAKYAAKNFTVLAVSIDQDRAAWEKALQEDNMPFIHVWDKKDVKSVSNLYMVKAIPTNFLLDPSGKIIATNLRGDKLEEFLAETL